jgi:hypothetical protein
MHVYDSTRETLHCKRNIVPTITPGRNKARAVVAHVAVMAAAGTTNNNSRVTTKTFLR